MVLIEFKDFKKTFGHKTVHRKVNFTVNAGECLGLLGGSGAGKSIILRSIIGLEKPDSGQILVDGIDITHMNDHHLTEVRKKVAYVFQDGALFDSLTVFENLAYPLKEHLSLTKHEIERRVVQTLAEFGLEKSINLFPSELSGGMKKRVGLARSTILEPQIILYDEPTAGLDPLNTRKIREMIMRLKSKGRTSVFVTHDIPTALVICDRLALLKDGEIATVLKTSDLYQSKNNPLAKFVEGLEA